MNTSQLNLTYCMFSYDMTMANACETLARRWLDCSDEQLGEFTYQDIAGFLPLQVEQFLAAFLNHVSLDNHILFCTQQQPSFHILHFCFKLCKIHVFFFQKLSLKLIKLAYHTVLWDVTVFICQFLCFQDPLSHAKIVKMGDTYKLNQSNNSEIKFR